MTQSFEQQPSPDQQPPAYTARDFEQELAAAPFFQPEQFALRWMSTIRGHEPGTPESLLAERLLRRQLISVYGLGTAVETLDQRDTTKVVRRVRLLGSLVDPEADPVDVERGTDFAYDFVHLVWKDALADNEAYDRAKHAERLHELATHDPLTGLKNRRGLEEDLDELIAQAGGGIYDGLALLYLDLDQFKAINDTYGHGVGDRVLKGVTNVLENNTRKPTRGGPADVIARPETAGVPESEPGSEQENDRPIAEGVRMGGDEFVLLIPFARPVTTAHPSRKDVEARPDPAESIFKIAERLTVKITDYILRETGGEVPGVGVSIGCVVWEPGMDANELIRRGDQHMFEIKRQRRLEHGNGGHVEG